MRFYYFNIILFLVFFVSCNTSGAKKTTVLKNEVEDINKPKDLRKIEFNIKGMTCEIGCARLIQSKLAKVDGINNVKISFKDSLGLVEYDKNRLNVTTIENIVNKISDGTLYKVYNVREK